MAKPISIGSMLTLLVLAAPARAQAPAPADRPAQAEPAPYEPSAAAPGAPTTESLQVELREMKARHEQQLGALSEQLAAHEAQSAVVEERDAIERERMVRIYGFADMGLMRTLPPNEGQLASQFTVPLTFYLGRLNLYFDSKPAQHFRFLAETRLSMYPNGSVASVNGGQVLRASTAVSDVAGPDQTISVNWGSIILERAVLDWTRYPLLSVRAGLFLTPFGVYNVDHGTPTLIAISLPVYIGQGWIPVRQIGLQVFGNHPIDRWELGYSATVSNGRTDGVLDAGDTKAFGGRVFLKRQGALRMLLGASALYQPYRRDQEQFGMDALGGVTYTRTRVVERTMLTVGVDQSLDYLGLRVRNELVFFESTYAPGKRELPPQAMGGFAPDSRQYNWSIIVAYRWAMIEPHLRSEVFWGSPTALAGTAWAPGAGVNVYLRPNVIVKAGWTAPRFYRYVDGSNVGAKQNFHSFVGILTWAF